VRGRNRGWKNTAKEQHDLKSSPNRTGVFRSGRMRRVSLGERKVCRVLVRKTERRTRFGIGE